MQFDVIIELFRYSRRLCQSRDRGRGLRCELNAPLDLANFVGVLVDGLLIAGAEILLQARQLVEQRIQNAPALLHARSPHFRRGATAEQPLKNDLWIKLHRERTAGRRPRKRVRVSAAITLAAVA